MTKDTVIRLANNTKYFLLDEYKDEEENKKFFYAIRLDNQTENPTNDYMLLEESHKEGKTYVQKVINKDLEQFLYTVFTDNLIDVAEEIKTEAK